MASSVIYYKFKSDLNTQEITFEGSSLTLRDLRNVIRERRGLKGQDCDLEIYDASTQHLYTKDEETVEKYTSVIVKRVAKDKLPRKAGGPSKPSLYVNRDEPTQDIMPPSAPMIDLSKRSDMSEEEKISKMMEYSTMKYAGVNYNVRRRPHGKPPSRYTCHKCHERGHWIHDCPGIRDQFGRQIDVKRIKRTTGVPRDFLTYVDNPMPGAMMTKDGRYAIAKKDMEAKILGKKEKKPFSEEENPSLQEAEERDLPDDLVCPLCEDIFKDAVIIKCCGSTFCNDCILNYLFDVDPENDTSLHCCPKCGQQVDDTEMLVCNIATRNRVTSYYLKVRERHIEQIQRDQQAQRMQAAMQQQQMYPTTAVAPPPPTIIAPSNVPYNPLQLQYNPMYGMTSTAPSTGTSDAAAKQSTISSTAATSTTTSKLTSLPPSPPKKFLPKPEEIPEFPESDESDAESEASVIVHLNLSAEDEFGSSASADHITTSEYRRTSESDSTGNAWSFMKPPTSVACVGSVVTSSMMMTSVSATNLSQQQRVASCSSFLTQTRMSGATTSMPNVWTPNTMPNSSVSMGYAVPSSNAQPNYADMNPLPPPPPPSNQFFNMPTQQQVTGPPPVAAVPPYHPPNSNYIPPHFDSTRPDANHMMNIPPGHPYQPAPMPAMMMQPDMFGIPSGPPQSFVPPSIPFAPAPAAPLPATAVAPPNPPSVVPVSVPTTTALQPSQPANSTQAAPQQPLSEEEFYRIKLQLLKEEQRKKADASLDFILGKRKPAPKRRSRSRSPRRVSSRGRSPRGRSPSSRRRSPRRSRSPRGRSPRRPRRRRSPSRSYSRSPPPRRRRSRSRSPRATRPKRKSRSPRRREKERSPSGSPQSSSKDIVKQYKVWTDFVKQYMMKQNLEATSAQKKSSDEESGHESGDDGAKTSSRQAEPGGKEYPSNSNKTPMENLTITVQPKKDEDDFEPDEKKTITLGKRVPPTSATTTTTSDSTQLLKDHNPVVSHLIENQMADKAATFTQHRVSTDIRQRSDHSESSDHEETKKKLKKRRRETVEISSESDDEAELSKSHKLKKKKKKKAKEKESVASDDDSEKDKKAKKKKKKHKNKDSKKAKKHKKNKNRSYDDSD